MAFYTICLLCLCSGLDLALAGQSSDLTENASFVLDAIQWQNSSCSNNTALPVSPALAEPEELNATSLDNNAKKVRADPSEIPGKATLISPKGTTKTGTASFVWSPVDGSISYHLWIDRAGSHVFDHWYLASEVTAGSICSAMPSKVLDKGTYSWKVQTRGDEGVGQWSNCMRFSVVPLTPPSKPSLISPKGTISNSNPTYTWWAVAGADRYLLIVDSPSRRNLIKQWFNESDVKSGSICSATPKKTLDVGTYTWRVLAGNRARDGPMSRSMKFGITTSKKWSFMVYMDGDNNLEEFAIYNILEMAKVGSSSDVNIVVQFDRIPGYDNSYGDWITGKRFYITKGMTPTPENAVMDIGEPDMGSPMTLGNFINWTRANYPASNYCLVIWNHGVGWKHYVRMIPWSDDTRSGDSLDVKGVCIDETNKTVLTMQDVGAALAASPVSLVNYDACFMQMAEVIYQDNPSAQVHVGSEEGVPEYGNPYDAILNDLVSKPGMTAEGLGRSIVQNYAIFYLPGTDHSRSWATISAAGDSAIPGMVRALDDLSIALINVEPGEHAHIHQAFIEADHYMSQSSVDLYDFARLIKLYVPDTMVRTAAQNLMDNVSATVISESHGNDYLNSHGISIYLPESSIYYLLSYENTRLARDSHWDEFLRKHLNIATAFNESFTSSVLPDKWIVANGSWSVGSGGLYSDDRFNGWPSIYYNAIFTNLTYEARIFRGGDAGSLNTNDGSNPNAIVVKGNPSALCDNLSASHVNIWDTAYYFQYSRNGKYSIWRSTGSGTWDWVQPWTDSPAINKGDAWNTLKIELNINQIRFFINDNLVFRKGDVPLSYGKVGLSYYAGDGGGFRADHATLITGSPIVGDLGSDSVEVSDEQKKLNEEAFGENLDLTTEGFNSGKAA
ncbi:MAG: clostripain-related cysteine peptidase [Methanothrix sp.]